MKQLVLVATLLVAWCRGTPEAEVLKPEWVAQDVACIERFRDAVKTEDLDVETLVAKLGQPGAHEDRDLGFGARSVHLHLYGGYTTIWVDVLAEARTGDPARSRVARLRVRQDGKEHWKELRPRLEPAWAGLATAGEEGFEFERTDEKLEGALRSKTAGALGGETPVAVPDELRAAFETLTDPLHEVAVGKHYGEDGAPPPGRREIEALARAGRKDLIRAVLRGLVPEARIYAAWELRSSGLALLDPQDAHAIETILALQHEVHATAGCVQVWCRPREALDLLERER